jgi:hypothetical protein
MGAEQYSKHDKNMNARNPVFTTTIRLLKSKSRPTKYLYYLRKHVPNSVLTATPLRLNGGGERDENGSSSADI